MGVNNRLLYLSGIVMGCLVSFPSVAADAASSDEDCLVVEWRADAYTRLNRAALEVRDQLLPVNNKPHSEESCLGDFTKVGMDISSIYPGKILGDLFKNVKSAGCKAARGWVNEMIDRTEVTIEAPLGSEVSIGLNGSGGFNTKKSTNSVISDGLNRRATGVINDASRAAKPSSGPITIRESKSGEIIDFL